MEKIVIKFPNPNYCIKWFIKGIKGNIQESKLSKTSNCFCPVLFSFPLGLFLIMKKAKEAPLNLNIDKFISINNITTAENKLESFGLLNNKVVCIDYENQ